MSTSVTNVGNRRAATRDPAQSGIALRFHHKGKPLPNLNVFIPGQGEDEPPLYQPQGADGFWLLPATGKTDVIAVNHDSIRTASWNLIDLPANANRYDFEVDIKLIEGGDGFNETLDIVGDALQLKQEAGCPMRFLRQ